jgi:hypothetical protein
MATPKLTIAFIICFIVTAVLYFRTGALGPGKLYLVAGLMLKQVLLDLICI